jgi:hypothetical protein
LCLCLEHTQRAHQPYAFLMHIVQARLTQRLRLRRLERVQHSCQVCKLLGYDGCTTVESGDAR